LYKQRLEALANQQKYLIERIERIRSNSGVGVSETPVQQLHPVREAISAADDPTSMATIPRGHLRETKVPDGPQSMCDRTGLVAKDKGKRHCSARVVLL
jgi:hypothetical protein